MKRLASLAVCLLLSAGVFAQAPPTVPLETKGDVKDIQVDKIITIKVDVKVINKFPVFVSFPVKAEQKDAYLYFWTYPSNIEAKEDEATLTVKSAPPGPLTLRLKIVGAVTDDAGKFLRFSQIIGEQSYSVGDPTPEPPPTPVDPPVPDEAKPSAELSKAIKDAYDNEIDPRKKDHAIRLASHYGGLVKALKKLGVVKTTTDFDKVGHDSVNVALSDEDLPKGSGASALTMVRSAASKFFQTRLPRAGQPVDDDFWKAASIALSQVSQAIKGAVK